MRAAVGVAGGTAVAVSSTNTALTAPASVTVNAGTTTAVFTARTGTLSSDQNATLTATTGPSSVNAVISLGAATLVSSLSCSPASLWFVYRGVLYSWQHKDAPKNTKSVLARLAAQAIAAGPR